MPRKAFRAVLAGAVVAASITLASAPAFAGNTCPNGGTAKAVTGKSFTVNGTSVGGNLKGMTQRGSTVTATFTVPKACPGETISLASYNALSAPPYTHAQINQQTLFDSDTGTYQPGTYTQTVTIPDGPGPSSKTTVISGTTVEWAGHGSDVLPCTDGGHWVLAPSKGVAAATLTVNGVTYAMTQNGDGSWAADSAGALTDTLTASAVYQGDSPQDVSLQLSHCNTYSHYQVDFSSSAVLTPPWFKAITPNPLISSDAQ